MCKSTCIHNFSSASPVDSPCVHDVSSASPVDSPCVHDVSSASPVDPPCLLNVSSPSPVDLPVAVAYAPRYYRRCGIGISIFYFSICTLCCFNVLHMFALSATRSAIFVQPFYLIYHFLLLFGIYGSVRRLTPVAMVTSVRWFSLSSQFAYFGAQR